MRSQWVGNQPIHWRPIHRVKTQLYESLWKREKAQTSTLLLKDARFGAPYL